MTYLERVDEFRDRRWAIVALLVLLALLGLGIGTITGGPGDFDGPGIVASTPTPTPTPTDAPTPTPDGGGDGTPTPEGGGSGDGTPTTDTPTGPNAAPTPTPTSRPGDGGGETPTPTPTATPTLTDTESDGGSGSGGGGSSSSGDGGSSNSGDDETSTPTDAPSDGEGEGDGEVDLETNGSDAILQFDGVFPGDSGRETVHLRNAGNVTAQFGVDDVNVTDHENGITEPESAVDTPGNGGELSAHVELVVEVRYPDGETEYLYGTGSGPKSLRTLAGAGADGASRELAPGDNATVTFDWHLPVETGNVVQSDGTTFTVDFGLAGPASDE